MAHEGPPRSRKSAKVREEVDELLGMEKRPLRPRPAPAAGPGSRSPDAETFLGRDDTALPGDEVQEWSELGATRVIGDASSASSTPTALRADDTALPAAAQVEIEKDIAVIGDFRLQKKLGEGAMGAVYKAYQISFQRQVALKILFKQVASNPKLVDRLQREGRAMGLLDHPNIVAGYGVDFADGWHYINMEYVDGQALQKWLGRLGRLSVADAVHIVLVCARALQYAHENGLVHRDIKPDNILITRKGQIKVADLGMVKTLDEDMSLTQTGHAVGTPWYMPLEQAKNAKDTDHRSDIYALGCMLYCLLTGQPPFAGKTLVEVIKSKEIGTFPPARSVSADVPERLDLIIVKMTAKHPKYRYQSCAEVVADLEGLELASERLSFVDGPARAAAATQRPQAAVTMAAQMSDSAEQEKPADEWYLRHKNGQGQVLVRRLTTAQVLKLLEDKSFDPTATISRKKNEGFRALATFKEFESAVLGRVSKEALDEQTVRYRNLYKKIEAEERAREKPKQRDGGNVSYWGGIFLKVAGVSSIVAFIGFVLWYFATNLGK
jgi:tRNA A-37 threonylcarbamoyl transferase component Bud32